MALATASADGMPSVRFVLLKGIDARGVEFFTNYESRKASELIANPRAALAVLWKPLHRQVRLEGPVEVLTPEESDAYFAPARAARSSARGRRSSPRRSRTVSGSRRGWPRWTRRTRTSVPRPPHWGGFRLVPVGRSSSGKAARTGCTIARSSGASRVAGPPAPGLSRVSAAIESRRAVNRGPRGPGITVQLTPASTARGMRQPRRPHPQQPPTSVAPANVHEDISPLQVFVTAS